MRSIEAMETEIESQREDLKKLDLPRQQTSIDNCVITGSGDSYVASSIARYVSGYKAICCHPMDIALNPDMVKNRLVYLVSASGTTRATILAAKVAKKFALRTIAITTRPESPLAKSSDDLILIRYNHASIPTSGTIGFTASMLCCVSLVCTVELSKVKKIYNESFALADSLTNYKIKRGKKREKGSGFGKSHVFLGNGIL